MRTPEKKQASQEIAERKLELALTDYYAYSFYKKNKNNLGFFYKDEEKAAVNPEEVKKYELMDEQARNAPNTHKGSFRQLVQLIKAELKLEEKVAKGALTKSPVSKKIAPASTPLKLQISKKLKGLIEKNQVQLKELHERGDEQSFFSLCMNIERELRVSKEDALFTGNIFFDDIYDDITDLYARTKPSYAQLERDYENLCQATLKELVTKLIAGEDEHNLLQTIAIAQAVQAYKAGSEIKPDADGPLVTLPNMDGLFSDISDTVMTEIRKQNLFSLIFGKTLGGYFEDEFEAHSHKVPSFAQIMKADEDLRDAKIAGKGSYKALKGEIDQIVLTGKSSIIKNSEAIKKLREKIFYYNEERIAGQPVKLSEKAYENIDREFRESKQCADFTAPAFETRRRAIESILRMERPAPTLTLETAPSPVPALPSPSLRSTPAPIAGSAPRRVNKLPAYYSIVDHRIELENKLALIDARRFVPRYMHIFLIVAIDEEDREQLNLILKPLYVQRPDPKEKQSLLERIEALPDYYLRKLREILKNALDKVPEKFPDFRTVFPILNRILPDLYIQELQEKLNNAASITNELLQYTLESKDKQDRQIFLTRYKDIKLKAQGFINLAAVFSIFAKKVEAEEKENLGTGKQFSPQYAIYKKFLAQENEILTTIFINSTEGWSTPLISYLESSEILHNLLKRGMKLNFIAQWCVPEHGIEAHRITKAFEQLMLLLLKCENIKDLDPGKPLRLSLEKLVEVFEIFNKKSETTQKNVIGVVINMIDQYFLKNSAVSPTPLIASLSDATPPLTPRLSTPLPFFLSPTLPRESSTLPTPRAPSLTYFDAKYQIPITDEKLDQRQLPALIGLAKILTIYGKGGRRSGHSLYDSAEYREFYHKIRAWGEGACHLFVSAFNYIPGDRVFEIRDKNNFLAAFAIFGKRPAVNVSTVAYHTFLLDSITERFAENKSAAQTENIQRLAETHQIIHRLLTAEAQVQSTKTLPKNLPYFFQKIDEALIAAAALKVLPYLWSVSSAFSNSTLLKYFFIGLPHSLFLPNEDFSLPKYAETALKTLIKEIGRQNTQKQITPRDFIMAICSSSISVVDKQLFIEFAIEQLKRQDDKESLEFLRTQQDFKQYWPLLNKVETVLEKDEKEDESKETKVVVWSEEPSTLEEFIPDDHFYDSIYADTVLHHIYQVVEAIKPKGAANLKRDSEKKVEDGKESIELKKPSSETTLETDKDSSKLAKAIYEILYRYGGTECMPARYFFKILQIMMETDGLQYFIDFTVPEATCAPMVQRFKKLIQQVLPATQAAEYLITWGALAPTERDKYLMFCAAFYLLFELESGPDYDALISWLRTTRSEEPFNFLCRTLEGFNVEKSQDYLRLVNNAARVKQSPAYDNFLQWLSVLVLKDPKKDIKVAIFFLVSCGRGLKKCYLKLRDNSSNADFEYMLRRIVSCYSELAKAQYYCSHMEAPNPQVIDNLKFSMEDITQLLVEISEGLGTGDKGQAVVNKTRALPELQKNNLIKTISAILLDNATPAALKINFAIKLLKDKALANVPVSIQYTAFNCLVDYGLLTPSDQWPENYQEAFISYGRMHLRGFTTALVEDDKKPEPVQWVKNRLWSEAELKPVKNYITFLYRILLRPMSSKGGFTLQQYKNYIAQSLVAEYFLQSSDSLKLQLRPYQLVKIIFNEVLLKMAWPPKKVSKLIEEIKLAFLRNADQELLKFLAKSATSIRDVFNHPIAHIVQEIAGEEISKIDKPAMVRLQILQILLQDKGDISVVLQQLLDLFEKNVPKGISAISEDDLEISQSRTESMELLDEKSVSEQPEELEQWRDPLTDLLGDVFVKKLFGYFKLRETLQKQSNESKEIPLRLFGWKPTAELKASEPLAWAETTIADELEIRRNICVYTLGLPRAEMLSLFGDELSSLRYAVTAIRLSPYGKAVKFYHEFAEKNLSISDIWQKIATQLRADEFFTTWGTEAEGLLLVGLAKAYHAPKAVQAYILGQVLIDWIEHGFNNFVKTPTSVKEYNSWNFVLQRLVLLARMVNPALAINGKQAVGTAVIDALDVALGKQQSREPQLQKLRIFLNRCDALGLPLFRNIPGPTKTASFLRCVHAIKESIQQTLYAPRETEIQILFDTPPLINHISNDNPFKHLILHDPHLQSLIEELKNPESALSIQLIALDKQIDLLKSTHADYLQSQLYAGLFDLLCNCPNSYLSYCLAKAWSKAQWLPEEFCKLCDRYADQQAHQRPQPLLFDGVAAAFNVIAIESDEKEESKEKESDFETPKWQSYKASRHDSDSTVCTLPFIGDDPLLSSSVKRGKANSALTPEEIRQLTGLFRLCIKNINNNHQEQQKFINLLEKLSKIEGPVDDKAMAQYVVKHFCGLLRAILPTEAGRIDEFKKILLTSPQADIDIHRLLEEYCFAFLHEVEFTSTYIEILEKQYLRILTLPAKYMKSNSETGQQTLLTPTSACFLLVREAARLHRYAQPKSRSIVDLVHLIQSHELQDSDVFSAYTAITTEPKRLFAARLFYLLGVGGYGRHSTRDAMALLSGRSEISEDNILAELKSEFLSRSRHFPIFISSLTECFWGLLDPVDVDPYLQEYDKVALQRHLAYSADEKRPVTERVGTQLGMAKLVRAVISTKLEQSLFLNQLIELYEIFLSNSPEKAEILYEKIAAVRAEYSTNIIDVLVAFPINTNALKFLIEKAKIIIHLVDELGVNEYIVRRCKEEGVAIGSVNSLNKTKFVDGVSERVRQRVIEPEIAKYGDDIPKLMQSKELSGVYSAIHEFAEAFYGPINQLALEKLNAEFSAETRRSGGEENPPPAYSPWLVIVGELFRIQTVAELEKADAIKNLLANSCCEQLVQKDAAKFNALLTYLGIADLTQVKDPEQRERIKYLQNLAYKKMPWPHAGREALLGRQLAHYLVSKEKKVDVEERDRALESSDSPYTQIVAELASYMRFLYKNGGSVALRPQSDISLAAALQQFTKAHLGNGAEVFTEETSGSRIDTLRLLSVLCAAIGKLKEPQRWRALLTLLTQIAAALNIKNTEYESKSVVAGSFEQCIPLLRAIYEENRGCGQQLIGEILQPLQAKLQNPLSLSFVAKWSRIKTLIVDVNDQQGEIRTNLGQIIQNFRALKLPGEPAALLNLERMLTERNLRRERTSMLAWLAMLEQQIESAIADKHQQNRTKIMPQVQAILACAGISGHDLENDETWRKQLGEAAEKLTYLQNMVKRATLLKVALASMPIILSSSLPSMPKAYTDFVMEFRKLFVGRHSGGKNHFNQIMAQPWMGKDNGEGQLIEYLFGFYVAVKSEQVRKILKEITASMAFEQKAEDPKVARDEFAKAINLLFSALKWEEKSTEKAEEKQKIRVRADASTGPSEGDILAGYAETLFHGLLIHWNMIAHTKLAELERDQFEAFTADMICRIQIVFDAFSFVVREGQKPVASTALGGSLEVLYLLMQQNKGTNSQLLKYVDNCRGKDKAPTEEYKFTDDLHPANVIKVNTVYSLRADRPGRNTPIFRRALGGNIVPIAEGEACTLSQFVKMFIDFTGSTDPAWQKYCEEGVKNASPLVLEETIQNMVDALDETKVWDRQSAVQALLKGQIHELNVLQGKRLGVANKLMRFYEKVGEIGKKLDEAKLGLTESAKVNLFKELFLGQFPSFKKMIQEKNLGVLPKSIGQLVDEINPPERLSAIVVLTGFGITNGDTKLWVPFQEVQDFVVCYQRLMMIARFLTLEKVVTTSEVKDIEYEPPFLLSEINWTQLGLDETEEPWKTALLFLQIIEKYCQANLGLKKSDLEVRLAKDYTPPIPQAKKLGGLLRLLTQADGHRTSAVVTIELDETSRWHLEVDYDKFPSAIYGIQQKSVFPILGKQGLLPEWRDRRKLIDKIHSLFEDPKLRIDLLHLITSQDDQWADIMIEKVSFLEVEEKDLPCLLLNTGAETLDSRMESKGYLREHLRAFFQEACYPMAEGYTKKVDYKNYIGQFFPQFFLIFADANVHWEVYKKLLSWAVAQYLADEAKDTGVIIAVLGLAKYAQIRPDQLVLSALLETAISDDTQRKTLTGQLTESKPSITELSLVEDSLAANTRQRVDLVPILRQVSKRSLEEFFALPAFDQAYNQISLIFCIMRVLGFDQNKRLMFYSYLNDSNILASNLITLIKQIPDYENNDRLNDMVHWLEEPETFHDKTEAGLTEGGLGIKDVPLLEDVIKVLDVILPKNRKPEGEELKDEKKEEKLDPTTKTCFKYKISSILAQRFRNTMREKNQAELSQLTKLKTPGLAAKLKFYYSLKVLYKFARTCKTIFSAQHFTEGEKRKEFLGLMAEMMGLGKEAFYDLLGIKEAKIFHDLQTNPDYINLYLSRYEKFTETLEDSFSEIIIPLSKQLRSRRDLNLDLSKLDLSSEDAAIVGKIFTGEALFTKTNDQFQDECDKILHDLSFMFNSKLNAEGVDLVIFRRMRSRPSASVSATPAPVSELKKWIENILPPSEPDRDRHSEDDIEIMLDDLALPSPVNSRKQIMESIFKGQREEQRSKPVEKRRLISLDPSDGDGDDTGKIKKERVPTPEPTTDELMAALEARQTSLLGSSQQPEDKGTKVKKSPDFGEGIVEPRRSKERQPQKTPPKDRTSFFAARPLGSLKTSPRTASGTSSFSFTAAATSSQTMSAVISESSPPEDRGLSLFDELGGGLGARESEDYSSLLLGSPEDGDPATPTHSPSSQPTSQFFGFQSRTPEPQPLRVGSNSPGSASRPGVFGSVSRTPTPPGSPRGTEASESAQQTGNLSGDNGNTFANEF